MRNFHRRPSTGRVVVFLLWISFIIHDPRDVTEGESEQLNEERIEKRILHGQAGNTGS